MMSARRWFLPLLVTILLGTPLAGAPALAQDSPAGSLSDSSVRHSSPREAFVPGQIIVQLRASADFTAKATSTLRSLQARFAGLGIGAATSILPHTYRLDVAKNGDMRALARVIAADPAVVYAQPNYYRSALRTVNDPLSTFQYGLAKINAYAAWDITTGSDSAVVAVVDSGVNASHPDLAGRVLPGYDFANDDADANDDVFHGTQVAGIIGASGDNGEGVAGMCWRCRILPVKVLDRKGRGSDDAVAQGIRWAADQGARVINMSLGGAEDSRVLHDAVKYATSKNALVVAAAGNEADEGNPVDYPAAYDEVIAVGATDENDQHAYFSQVHPYVDVSAPGWNIASTGNQENLSAYGADSGTSFAAPYVAGLAGLLLSVNPNLDVGALKSLIVNNADDLGQPGADWEFGAGRINAGRALATVRVPAFEPVANPNVAGVAFFAETGHTLRGTLRSFWEQNGGLPVFGYPVSEEFQENTPEGAFAVQYFERNRLELHPEKPAPYNVLLGRLSDTLLQRQARNWFTFPKGQAAPGCQLFVETGHTLCEPFLGYWKAHGLRDPKLDGFGRSLALFGMPLSEPSEEQNSSGETVLTQWFERARFEYHSDKPEQFKVLLGLLGNETGRPGAGGPPPSGQTPANRCEGLPAPVNVTVQPSGCVLVDTYLAVDAQGFKPGEKVDYYFSAPSGEAIPIRVLQAGSDGHVRGRIGVFGLEPGFWAVVLQGMKSNNKAIIYLKVVDR